MIYSIQIRSRSTFVDPVGFVALLLGTSVFLGDIGKVRASRRKDLNWGIPVQTGLHECIESTLRKYFEDLDGHSPQKLYSLFMSEVEKPFLRVVMQQVDGNITHATRLLGISRATLRRRLKKHGFI